MGTRTFLVLMRNFSTALHMLTTASLLIALAVIVFTGAGATTTALMGLALLIITALTGAVKNILWHTLYLHDQERAEPSVKNAVRIEPAEPIQLYGKTLVRREICWNEGGNLQVGDFVFLGDGGRRYTAVACDEDEADGIVSILTDVRAMVWVDVFEDSGK